MPCMLERLLLRLKARALARLPRRPTARLFMCVCVFKMNCNHARGLQGDAPSGGRPHLPLPAPQAHAARLRPGPRVARLGASPRLRWGGIAGLASSGRLSITMEE